MPDLSDPTFALGVVAEDGEAQMALFGKAHLEMYLMMDPEWSTPRARWQTFLKVHERMRLAASGMGFDSVTAYIPPQLVKAFGRRLEKLGWGRDQWSSFSFKLR